MRSWSVNVGRIFGAELRIHLSFAFLLLFVWMTEAALPHASLARGLAMVVLVVISVLAHEIGHGLAALHEDLPARSIILLPIGGVKEKVLGALRAGITTIILPKENLADLEDIREDERARLEVHPVEHLSEVLALTLRQPKSEKRSTRSTDEPRDLALTPH